MKLVLRLVATGADGSSRSVDVQEIVSRSDPGDIAAQCRDHAMLRPTCRSCAAVCQVKDYRPRRIATLFGQVTLRLPRFRCAGMEAGHGWPAHCRSTPELDQVRALPIDTPEREHARTVIVTEVDRISK